MKLRDKSQVAFNLFDVTLAEMSPELLGLWTTQSRSLDVAFDLSSGTTSSVPLWRANLPADLKKAAIQVTDSEARLNRSQRALGKVSDRISCLVIPALGVKTDLAFDLSHVGQQFEQPEQELLASLQEIQRTQEIGQSQSFGVDQYFLNNQNRGFKQFKSLSERLLGMVTNYAWVETQLQGQTFAQTVISWKSDVHSVWERGINSDQIELHQRTLALSLASQNTLFQTFSVAVQTAVKLSVVLSMPGGFILALPATWKFIHQVMAQSGDDV